MVKPKFQMKIQRTSYHIQYKPNSKAEAIVKRKNINEREKQIQAAVNCCEENGNKGYVALLLSTKSSQAPLCTPKKALRSSFSTVISPLTPNSLSNTTRKKFWYGSKILAVCA